MVRLTAFRPTAGGLSTRLLLLTVLFVMLSQVLIFLISVGRYRVDYLDNRVDAAYLATFALTAAPNRMVSRALANQLLAHVGAHGIMLHRPDHMTLMLDAEQMPHIDATYDLRSEGFFMLLADAMMTLRESGDRVVRIIAPAPQEPAAYIVVLLDEPPLRRELLAYSSRVIEVSIIISLVTATLLYVSLRWLLVTPLLGLIAAMMRFRADPEDGARIIVPSDRRDELGWAQRELAAMQETVRQALRQKARLAALGTAVTKINHDLRNILSTARLMSDRIADGGAPEARRATPPLLAAIDRAVALCSRTLTFTREGAPPLHRTRFALAGLVEELAEPIERPGKADPGTERPGNEGGGTERSGAERSGAERSGAERSGIEGSAGEAMELFNAVPPGLLVTADRDQLFRALANLARNAAEAGASEFSVVAREEAHGLVIEAADDGPGLPPKARDNLFRPFAGSARPGGTGLGLAIAREVMRAHGGEIALGESTASGTVFILTLPDGVHFRAAPVDVVEGAASAEMHEG